MSKGYYVQDARGYVGNCMLWWKSNNCGYTCDLREAKVFTLPEIAKMHSVADGTKKAWPKDYIDARQEPHVDMQSCDDNQAADFTEIKTPTP